MDRIIEHLHLDARTAELLHDRRGTTFYRIDRQALKITTGLMAGREGEILQLLDAAFYRSHGWDGERSWLLMRWIDGTSLWDALGPDHHGGDRAAAQSRILARVGVAAHALADLHAHGWSHADLQPDHIVFDEAGATHLIDLACAQGPADVPFYVHRGGIAHVTAPEIAQAILDSDEHVTATPEADVWSLGAAIWWAWTRTMPIAYTDPGAGRMAQMADIAAVRRTPAAAAPWPFPELVDIAMACMAPDPGQRPAAKEIAAALDAGQ